MHHDGFDVLHALLLVWYSTVYYDVFGTTESDGFDDAHFNVFCAVQSTLMGLVRYKAL